MPYKNKISWVSLINLIVISCVLLLLSNVECIKKQEGIARKEDIPFIKCQVCHKLASQLHSLVLNKEALISPKKISEYEIIEIVENVCNLKKEEADWVLKIDIVEKGDKLEGEVRCMKPYPCVNITQWPFEDDPIENASKIVSDDILRNLLVDQDVEGHCNSECKTIERACQVVLGDSDTDVAEYIYARRPQLDSLVNYMCKDLTKACSKKAPPVPKDRTPGEQFVPKPTKEAEMEKMMRSMEGLPGAPGMKMYSREELMKQTLGGGDLDDDSDDDDDDQDTKFKSNLGNAFRATENNKIDWKEKALKHVKGVGNTIKTHAYKVKHNLRKWWRSKRKVPSKKKSAAKKAEL